MTTMTASRIFPGDGWAMAFGPVVYDRTRTGAPLGFADVWRETHGVGHAAIYRPDGTLYLANAGSTTARDRHVATVRQAEQDRLLSRTVAAHLAHRDHLGYADHPGACPDALARLRAHPAYARVRRQLDALTLAA